MRCFNELLHIERFWLEKTPRLMLPNEDPVALDNALEHLVIVPRAKALYGRDQQQRWSSIMQRGCERICADPHRSSPIWRGQLLLSWATVAELISDNPVRRAWKDLLVETGRMEEAESFHAALAAAKGDKLSMIRVALDHLFILGQVRVDVFDIRARTIDRVDF